MFRKIIVSFLCAIMIAGMVFAGFCCLYFSLPSRQAAASISLPDTVADSSEVAAEAAQEATTEDSAEAGETYVADVYQSLTLRAEASANSVEITSLPPMTHLSVLEFVEGTSYAYVKVTSGTAKGYKGYVNSDYITKLGEATIRVGTEE